MSSRTTIVHTLILAIGAGQFLLFALAACDPAATSVATPTEISPTEVTAEAPTSPTTELPTAAPTETPSEELTPYSSMIIMEPVVELRLVAEGFTSPVTLVSPADGTGRLFVVDQIGLIRIVTVDGGLLEEPFLDVRDRMVQLNAAYDERGLLGLAFHPEHARNGRFFVHYTAPLRPGGPKGWDNTVRISEFTASKSDFNRADSSSERILLQVDEPQSNHQGGTVAFGPDGYLYISLGDGGASNDVGLGHNPKIGNGQDTTTLLGKILRIDVDSGEPYSIPEDNPFAQGGGAPEIFAYGLRNPYRFSFDMGGDNELLVADVGQDLYEEVNIIVNGGNYGWNIKEGIHCFDPDSPSQPPPQCPDAGEDGERLINPIIEYDHDLGISVTGGYIYRGKALAGWDGSYIFADWSTAFIRGDGKLLVATPPTSGEGIWSMQEISIATNPEGHVGLFVLGLGQDAEGELYVLTQNFPSPAGNSGKVFKIAPSTTDGN